mgnify:CR=1 FL=1
MENKSKGKAVERIYALLARIPEFEKEVAAYKEQDEDVLSYALFPQVATEYFKYRDAQEKKVDVTEGNEEAYPV